MTSTRRTSTARPTPPTGSSGPWPPVTSTRAGCAPTALSSAGATIEYGQSDPPGGKFRSVTTGSWHSCGGRTDGAVLCWGANGDERTEPPDESDSTAGSYTQVAAGGGHTCALRVNRTIVCWGNNEHGQTDVPRR